MVSVAARSLSIKTMHFNSAQVSVTCLDVQLADVGLLLNGLPLNSPENVLSRVPLIKGSPSKKIVILLSRTRPYALYVTSCFAVICV